MSEEGEISPVREKSSPESTHSLEEVTIKPSQKKGEKRTPSPKRSKGENSKRRRKNSDSFSGSSSSSSSSSESSDSERVSDCDKSPFRKQTSDRTTNSPPLQASNTSADKEQGVYVRFTAAGETAPKLHLSKDMINYLHEQFSTYLKDKILKETILQSNPVPNVDCLTTPEIDDYLGEIFESLGRSYGRSSDTGLSRVQTRISNIMGPLGKLWLALEDVRTGKADTNVDLFECLKLVEQSITLIGQAKISLTYERRLAILYRLTGDFKKAKKLMSKHESSLLESRKTLFGHKFYKALCKATKIKKSSKEISSHIGGSRGKQQGSLAFSQRGKSSNRVVKNYQPFRQTPSSQYRGGGRSISFRGRTGGSRGYSRGYSRGHSKGKSIIIKFSTTKGRSPKSKLCQFRAVSFQNSAHCAQSEHNGPTNCPKGHSSSFGKPRAGHLNSKTVPPICREITTLPEQLEVTDTRSIYSTSGNWGNNTLPENPLPGTCSSPSISQPTREGNDRKRNRNDVGKGSDSGGLSSERGVYKLSISSPQKRWGKQTCNKPQESKFVCNISTLQNGRVAPVEADPSEGGFHGQNRPEGCLLLCPNAPKASALPEVYLGEDTVSVQLPTLRPGTSPTSFHQIVEANCGPASQTGPEIDCVSGRYNSIQSNSRRDVERQGHCTLATSTVGFCNQLEKVCVNPSTYNGIPGFCDQFSGNDPSITRAEIAKTDSVLPAASLKQGFFCKGNCQGGGEANLIHAGNPPSALTLQTLTNAADKNSASREIIRDTSYPGSELSGRSSVVDRSHHQLEWSCHNYVCSRPSNNYGCIIKGLGSSLPGHSYKRPLDPTRGSLHINALELMAALFAVRAFTANRTDIHVHLRMDNRTAITYILKMGDTRSTVLLQIAQELWEFSLSNKIILTAEYLPGVLNQQADWESRHFHDSSDWKLNPGVFKTLNQQWGPLEVDLFASRTNCQLSKYVSWFPDPFAMATDAFQISWTDLKGYSFPPFSLICHCLAKIRKDQATLVMITPTWPTQAWYPMLLGMSCRHPILLPPLEDLLVSPSHQIHPLVQQGSLTLAAWMVSGKVSLQEEFWEKLPSYSAPIPGAKALEVLTTAPGHSGVAGVFSGKLIHFAPLWPL